MRVQIRSACAPRCSRHRMSCEARPSCILAEQALHAAHSRTRQHGSTWHQCLEGKLTRPERRHTNRACLVQPPQAPTKALVLRTAVRLSGCSRSQSRPFMPCPSPRVAAVARRRIYNPRSRSQMSLAQFTRESDPPHSVVVVPWDDAAMRLYWCQIEVSSCPAGLLSCCISTEPASMHIAQWIRVAFRSLSLAASTTRSHEPFLRRRFCSSRTRELSDSPESLAADQVHHASATLAT